MEAKFSDQTTCFIFGRFCFSMNTVVVLLCQIATVVTVVPLCHVSV